jgi:Leu/Phe-tRNA-protein transferase
MAHSVLVVGTAVGSLPRAFQTGREMLFVEPDPTAVVGAVQTLLEDAALRRAVIERAWSWAMQTSLEEVVSALAAAIVRRWPELVTERVQDAAP